MLAAFPLQRRPISPEIILKGLSWKKLSNILKLYAKNAEDVLLSMFVTPPPPEKCCVLCEIFRAKVFGLVTSFGLRFLSYRTGFAADDLRRTTSACYPWLLLRAGRPC